MAYVLAAYIVGAEEPKKRRPLRRSLDRWPSLRFLTFHQANHADHPHPSLARGFDGRHRRSAGGTDVVNHNHRCVRLLKALDAPASAVGLFSPPHQKTIH